ncbi:MAG: lytic transglycosylase domain-containing protein [Pseudomonadota bacterium]
MYVSLNSRWKWTRLPQWQVVLLLCGALIAGNASAASVYVYVNAAGNRLITDHPRSDLPGYTLLKKYTADDHFGTAYRPKSRSVSRGLVPRVTDYDRLIRLKADEFGLEPALLKAVIHVESAFNPEALSPKGALGLMQLMPATATRYGVYKRTDPVESLNGGGRYLRDLLAMFNFDTRLALAAYNAGENAVQRYNGIPPYRETEDYVEKVIALRDKYRKGLIGA